MMTSRLLQVNSPDTVAIVVFLEWVLVSFVDGNVHTDNKEII